MSALGRKPPYSRKDSGWPLYIPNPPLRPGMKTFQIERQLLREKQTVATCLLCMNEGRLTARSGRLQSKKKGTPKRAFLNIFVLSVAQ